MQGTSGWLFIGGRMGGGWAPLFPRRRLGARPREQGLAGQRRAADDPIGLRVAAERGPGGALRPLRGGRAKLLPSRPRLRGLAERHLGAQ